jgi:hypothetical protein
VSMLGTGGATGGALGGVVVATGAGGTIGTTVGAGGNGAINVESLPACPDYVTEFAPPIEVSPACGISADNHLLYGCVGVERQGYPFDTDPCQFTDPNDAYNGSHVFGCVDKRGC